MAPQRHRSAWYTAWALSVGSLLGASCNGVELVDLTADPTSPAARQACPTTLAVQRIGAGETVLRVDANSPLRGARLEIPAGAMPPGTTVRLGLGPALGGGEIAEMDGEPHGPSLCVETDRPLEGIAPPFAKPAFLILPYDPWRLGDRKINYLAMAQADSFGLPPRRMGDLLVVDEPRHLAGAKIKSPGIYSIITVGKGRPAVDPRLSMLFVIDNSGSMVPKQKALAALLPTFFDQVTRTGPMEPSYVQKCVQYNIGVLTTDLGQDVAVGGDKGELQTQFCHQRMAAQRGWSTGAQTACNNFMCPTAAPLTKRYISRDPMVPPSVNKKQFECMAFVGDGGSGVEQPLESLSRALNNDPDIKLPIPMGTEKFFRAGGLNSILFLTDEGDCSTSEALGRRQEFFAPTQPCDAADPKQPSCYADLNHRCLGTALKCDQKLTTNMKTRMTCSDREMGAVGLRPAKEYADELRNFILKLNGDTASELEHLLVRGIWPLRREAMMLETTASFIFDPQNRPPSNTLRDEAFCFDPDSLLPMKEPILGHPQVRLNNFIKSLIPAAMPGDPAHAKVGSICVPKDSGMILEDLAATIVNNPAICPMALE